VQTTKAPDGESSTQEEATERPAGFDDSAAKAKRWLAFGSKEFRTRHPAEWRAVVKNLPDSVVKSLSGARSGG